MNPYKGFFSENVDIQTINFGSLVAYIFVKPFLRTIILNINILITQKLYSLEF